MTVSRVQISENGPYFSRFIAGYWRLNDRNWTVSQRLEFLQQHIDLGITTIDHADIYGDYRCEQGFGEALAQAPELREKIEIVTKCDIKLVSEQYPEHYLSHYDTSKAHIVSSVEQSLTRLGTEYIDLFLLHRPDPLMDADEVAEIFTELQLSGKVLHFGVSNFSAAQFDLLNSRLESKLVTNQIEISPYQMGCLFDGSLEHCQQHRISPMAWSCLGGGNILTGQDEKAWRLREVLHLIANQLGGVSIEQVIYAWVMALPCKPLPLLGTGNINRMRDAVSAEELKLDRQQWFSIWQASMGHSVS